MWRWILTLLLAASLGIVGIGCESAAPPSQPAADEPASPPENGDQEEPGSPEADPASPEAEPGSP